MHVYRPEKETIKIHTGLSVEVCGHLIDLRVIEENKTAIVRVKQLKMQPLVSKSQKEEIRIAANHLASRAKRFLGQDWNVSAWSQTAMGKVG